MNKTLAQILLFVSTLGFVLFGSKFVFALFYANVLDRDTLGFMLLHGAGAYVSLNYIFDRWE